MRLLIAAVGRLKQGPERELFAHYLARAEALGRKLGLTPITTIEIAEPKAKTAPERKAAEAAALLGKIPAGHKLIGLDENGEALSSESFARLIGSYRDHGVSGLAVVIGGADGLGCGVLAKADKMVSLGPMTLPHGLARIVLAEQIYRVATILAGHPYHRT
jgi:23S rRNA (pseudouridine1915-N3)-methyltransferase